MVRTQIQLTEAQAAALRRLAARRGASMAEVIRQGVERRLAEVDQREKREAALALLGLHDIGPDNAARKHDRCIFGEDRR